MNRLCSTIIALMLLSVFLFSISCAGIPQQTFVPAPVQQIKQMQLQYMNYQQGQPPKPQQLQYQMQQIQVQQPTVQNKAGNGR